MIRVELRLFGDLRKYYDTPMDVGEKMFFEGETSVLDIVNKLGIPIDETKIIFVNGRLQELDYILSHDDRLAIFPAVAGG